MEGHNVFSVNVHHDGLFLFNPIRYGQGQELLVETMQLSLPELVRYIEAQIANVVEGLYYLAWPGEMDSLMKLGSERDVEVFFDLADTYGRMEVYCEHVGVNLDNFVLNLKDLPEEIDVEEHREGLYDTEEQENDKNVVGDETKNTENDESNQEKECIRTTEGGESSRFQGDYDSDDDVDFVVEDVDSDTKSAASLEHLSEGEDEVRDVRQGRPIVVIPSERQLPTVDREAKKDDKSVIQQEHDQFLKDLVQAMTNQNTEDEYADPLQPPPDDVPTFPVHDKATH